MSSRAVEKRRPRSIKTPAELITPARLVPIFTAAVAEEVASSIRHDFVNHLSAIANAGFRLQSLVGDGEEVRRVVGMITQRVTAAAAGLSREIPLASSAPLDLDPREQTARFLESLTMPAGVRLAGPESAMSVPIRISADELDLALFCLVKNAVEATAAGGGGSVHVRLRARAGEVEIEVSDEGPGLSAEAVDHAFEPFFTTKARHLGLGLPIAKRIAYRWSGRLELAAGEPSGVHALLRLPVTSA